MRHADTVRREYVIHFSATSAKVGILLQFLLKHTDVVCVTRSYWRSLWPLSLKKFGSDNDPMFVKHNAEIKNAFVKEGVSGKKQLQYYQLTLRVKAVFTEAGLFFNAYDRSPLYGFEDPAFYKDEELLAKVITHERLVLMYLTEIERASLEAAGLRFVLSVDDSSHSCLLPQ